MKELPVYIDILFGLTVIGIILWFYYAFKSNTFLILATTWLIFQSILGLQGVYQNTEAIPPRILLFGIFPSLILIIAPFLTQKGRGFMDKTNLKTLTWLHTIRVPVEIVLLLLFQYGMVSVYMTWGGTNFDLFSGLTAPLAAYFAFRTGKVNRKFLLGWNVLCLLLLLNVVITAAFAIPSPFQQLSHEQPNIAVLHFPFNLLPSVVVPIVLFAHLVAIRKLTRKDILINN